MATRAELFASGELKSPLNVKEKVIKTLRDAAEEGGGGGSVIILYPTDSLPTTNDLPEAPVGLEWELDSENNRYVSREKNGTALTFTELSEVLEEYFDGATVCFMNDTEQTEGEYTMKIEASSQVIDAFNMTATDGNDELVAVSIIMTAYNNSDFGCRFDARTGSGQ